MSEIALPDASSVKALNRGDATPEQQQRALEWLMKKACQIGGISFDPDPHVTAFNEGRRFVGLQILYVLNEPMTTFEPPPKPATRRK